MLIAFFAYVQGGVDLVDTCIDGVLPCCILAHTSTTHAPSYGASIQDDQTFCSWPTCSVCSLSWICRSFATLLRPLCKTDQVFGIIHMRDSVSCRHSSTYISFVIYHKVHASPPSLQRRMPQRQPGPLLSPTFQILGPLPSS